MKTKVCAEVSAPRSNYNNGPNHNHGIATKSAKQWPPALFVHIGAAAYAVKRLGEVEHRSGGLLNILTAIHMVSISTVSIFLYKSASHDDA